MPEFSWTESYGNKYFLDYDLSQLKRDECWVSINNTANTNISLHGLYEECVGCSYQIIQKVLPKTISRISLSTANKRIYRFLNEDAITADNASTSNVICSMETELGEFGVYNIKVTNTNCTIETLKEPVSIYFPLITVFLIYAVLFSLIPIGRFIWKKIKCSRLDKYPVSKEYKDEEQNSKERLKSLDTFRGISIILMIFANYGAGGYTIFEHVVWNGLHLSDLVFPWFLWIMGVCIPISLTSVLKQGVSKTKALRNILKRSCILFGLGIFLGSTPYLDRFVFSGILQRFGICYLFVASLCLTALSQEQPEEKTGFQRHFKDFIVLRYQWIVTLITLAIYCLIIYFLEVPGCPTGYLGPGGNHEGGIYYNCTGGATGYIDRLILGKDMYHWLTFKDIYDSRAFEGILGCIPCIFLVFIGLQTGVILLKYKKNGCRLRRWLIWATITGAIGGALCSFSKEDGVIPINKKLTSISYVLVSASFSFILLSICYYLIDMKKCWNGKPFMFAGMNSILLYVGHEMIASNFPFHWNFAEHDVRSTHFMFMVTNLWATSLWVVVAYYLYKKEFFLSI